MRPDERRGEEDEKRKDVDGGGKEEILLMEGGREGVTCCCLSGFLFPVLFRILAAFGENVSDQLFVVEIRKNEVMEK